MDIDIDLAPGFKPEDIFNNAVKASRIEKDEIKPHNVGFYFQNIPVDPISNLAAIPYNAASELGYYKVDMLTVHFLKVFESKEEIKAVLRRPVNWKLLDRREVVEKLFHLGNHFYVVDKIKPTSVLELADCIAIIRPNKIRLLDKYPTNKKAIRKEIYTKREASDMRKSHAIAYALLVVLQLNLIELGVEL